MKHELENKGKRKGCNGKNKGAVKKFGRTETNNEESEEAYSSSL